MKPVWNVLLPAMAHQASHPMHAEVSLWGDKNGRIMKLTTPPSFHGVAEECAELYSHSLGNPHSTSLLTGLPRSDEPHYVVFLLLFILVI
jgi:hypothetical protein